MDSFMNVLYLADVGPVVLPVVKGILDIFRNIRAKAASGQTFI